ncbi:Glutamate receptor 3.2 [Apostasia shenzhenica]|uniref:Glutamate receptor n=1 Tax=Apostasia shenzhenica TaxID=1088818 RepID=A0A2H9ZY42_9ASPA|nr:Glutamate receptor 3.2 [Apostasia shenzhenica]
MPITALQFMENDVAAIIGPQSSVLAHVVTHIVNELQVPLLSFAATDPTLSSLQYPFFVRITQSDVFQMAAIAELVDYFQWREVIAIFIDDDYGRNGVATLNEKLTERRSKIFFKAALGPEANVTNISDLLIKVALMECRVIILHANPDIGRIVLSAAYRLDMTINGYAWIATDWLPSLLDSYGPLDSETMDTMQGVLSLRQHTPNTQRKRDLVLRWRELIGGDNGGDFRLNSYGLYAYDSVWMIAHALDAFFDDGGAIIFSNDSRLQDANGGTLDLKAIRLFDGGSPLLNKVRSTSFDGVTGPVQLDSDGNLIHPAYDILNIVGTGSRSIGYWSNYSGLSIESPETLYLNPPNRSNQILYDVIWPGQTTQKPRGWAFPNNGRELRIGVPYRVSYPEFVSKEKGSDTMKGYCLDVFFAAINLLQYPITYRLIPFGNGFENPNYTELVEKVVSKDFDAAVGDITIVTGRTKEVDFTQPFIESGLVILTSVKERDSNAWAFLQPFTWAMWAVTATFFLFIGSVIWILEHRINDEFRGPPKKQLVTIFCKDPIGYQVGSFTETYLTQELNISSSRLKVLHNPSEYATSLELGPDKGGVAAVIDEHPYVELFLSTNCKFAIVGSEFTKTGWGFAFPLDSPLAVDMSTAILKLSENGDLQRIHDKWLMRSSCSSDSMEIESNRLQLNSFWGLYAICGGACFLALLIYFIIIICQFHRHFAEQEPETPEEGSSKSGSSRSGRILQSFLSFADDKQGSTRSKSNRGQMEQSARTNDVDFVS